MQTVGVLTIHCKYSTNNDPSIVLDYHRTIEHAVSAPQLPLELINLETRILKLFLPGKCKSCFLQILTQQNIHYPGNNYSKCITRVSQQCNILLRGQQNYFISAQFPIRFIVNNVRKETMTNIVMTACLLCFQENTTCQSFQCLA